MVNYFDLIDPYLYGTLEPEVEELFERQLTHNQDLADVLSQRFSAAFHLARQDETPGAEQPASEQTAIV